MNQREKISSNKSSNNTRLRSSNQSIEKEPDNLKPSAQKPSFRPLSSQKINLPSSSASPSASSPQKINLTSSRPNSTSSPQKINLTSSSPSPSTSSSQKINSSPKQPNLEKLEAIRERYGIQLPSKYGKDIVEKALEKREEYRKKTPSDDMDLSGQYITYIISLFFANYFYIFYILHRGQLSEFSKRIIRITYEVQSVRTTK